MADIVDTLINDGRFTTLVEAINRASLLQGLMEPASITLFAPTDEAFSKLPSGTVGIFLDNPPELEKLLTYHVIASRIPSTDADALSSAPTVEGSTLAIDTSDGIKVNDAKVIEPDIESDNGIIHIIDTVLIPQSIGELLVTS
ncbi:MAG: fasciclin domain-containing protein [Nostoc sp. ChiQUE02]|uniref:fasciclin domain-containing protein n=1 Tax=Nostoc sp. ChiQUE02 TaxID=3075377 RepID=UPI002AD504E9|nr:fasciclin domain-containing protein [Nostoc sp. ChiQUE02]MDZ8229534.1 fasciclin domain-containing protein [Nostoc sp. ChiQUE02]